MHSLLSSAVDHLGQRQQWHQFIVKGFTSFFFVGSIDEVRELNSIFVMARSDAEERVGSIDSENAHQTPFSLCRPTEVT